MIQPILDISHWQGVFDWQKAKDASVRAVMVRAGSVDKATGVVYEDRQWDRNSVEGPKYLQCGSYWFFRPQHSAIKQAQFYASLLAGKDFSLPAVLDYESNDLLLSKAACSIAGETFVRELERLTGKQPMIYTRKTWWDVNCGRTTWAGKLKLWVAHYTLAQEPWIPVDWTTWELWQYSSKGDGPRYGAQSLSIDLNRSRDTFLTPPSLTLEERVDKIEARLEAAGIP